MPLLPPPCAPAQLAITATGAADFNGMSHAGTYLNLRNTGRRACSLPGLPLVRLLDARGRTLPAQRRAPVGMHPGPVVLPVTVPAGWRVRLSLRWVSGEVYDHSRCLTATRVTVAGAGARLPARLCGPAGAPIVFEQTVLTPLS